MSKKNTTQAAKKATKKPATNEAVEPETRLRCTVIRPEGTKFKNVSLGYGWSGPEGLPEKESMQLEKLGHVRIDGVV